MEGGTSRNLPYRAHLRPRDESERAIPPYHLMVSELRGGGWHVVAHVRALVERPEDAFEAVLLAGLAPGTCCDVTLEVAGTESEKRLRCWPSVITGVATKHHDEYPLCAVTLSDPVSALAQRALWLGWSNCAVEELFGAALSAAGLGDGRPTRNPVLENMPTIQLRAKVRDEIASVPYAIACGETLHDWCNEVLHELKARLEITSTDDGDVIVTVTDVPATQSDLNAGGAIDVLVDHSVRPSSRVVHLANPTMRSHPVKAGMLLDNPSSGDAINAGRPGPIEDVLDEPYVKIEEAEARVGRKFLRGASAQLRVNAKGAHPAMMPGRTLNFTWKTNSAEMNSEEEGQGEGLSEIQRERRRLFGAEHWQVCDVAHFYHRSAYFNRMTMEKGGSAWCPQRLRTPPARMVSAVIDGADKENGEHVTRDALGWLPVRMAHARARDEASGDSLWSNIISLAATPMMGGAAHGFIGDQRQGDLCRIRVHSPLLAEIAGFTYRDDRSIKDSVLETSAAMMVRQKGELRRGFGFEFEEEEPGEAVDSEVVETSEEEESERDRNDA